MNLLITQQCALDDALVAPKDRSMIGKCNMRIEPTKTQKEAMYQVVMDTLKVFPCYKAFLVTDDIPEIYMHQFWFTISKIKESLSYKFQLDKKKFKVGVEVFHEVLQIFPRLPNQEFVKPPSYEEIVTFIKELGYIGELESITKMFTKAIIQHFISKDKTISVRNNLFMHGIKNDNVLGILKFVSKYEENQVYRKPILDVMLSKEVTKTKAYKTYLAFATRNAIRKKARKRTTTHIKECSLIADNNIIPNDPDVALELAKSIRRTKVEDQEAANLDTPTVTKKKTPEQSLKLKGMEMLLDAAMLASNTKKAIKASKCDFRPQHQTGGSSEGAGSKPEVPNESIGDSENDDDDHKSNDERTKSDDDKSIDLNKIDDEEEIQGDEFELYDDVNVEMKDAKPADEGKEDEEMTDAEKVDAEHKEINQEVASVQVQDEVQTTTIAAPVTQKEKTDVPPSSSSLFVSSNYAAPATTIPPFTPPVIPTSQQSTPPPILTTSIITTKAPTSTSVYSESETLSALQIKVFDLEKEVKELKQVDLTTTLSASIRSEVPQIVNEYLGSSLGDALSKELQKHTEELRQKYSLKKIISSNKTTLAEFDQKQALFDSMHESKSFKKYLANKTLYHALMESLIADEDAMDQEVADLIKHKKRPHDDEDRDQDPPAGSNQRLKKRKTSKDAEPSKRSKSTGSSKGNTSSQINPKSTGKSVHAEETVYEAEATKTPQNQGDDMGTTNEQPNVEVASKNDWFKKPKSPPTPDPEWNKGKLVDNEPTQNWLNDLAKAGKPPLTFNELMSTLINFSEFAMNRL
ncbi:hypothetical protein Tco_0735372 [Tanacetum coccineum]